MVCSHKEKVKVAALRGGSASGTGRAEQLSAGSGGLCSSDFSLWVTSREDAEKLVLTSLKRKSKSQGGSQLPLQGEADSSVRSGVEAFVIPEMGPNVITYGEELLRPSSTTLYFLFVVSQG